MNDFKVLPYKQGSRSARALADALGCKVLSLTNSNVKNMSPKFVINWGNSRVTQEELGQQHSVYNSDSRVYQAANKLMAFDAMDASGIRIPNYTRNRDEAQEWVNEGHTVVERHTLNGNSGEGIILKHHTDDDSNVNPAPLYTKYVKKQQEYRVHVVNGVVIDVQRKARRLETPDSEVNWKIRNLAGGFVFTRGGVNPDEDVLQQSLEAVRCLGLDFGAVDVIWNKHEGNAYVLEVNAAPGLEGQTLESYKNAFIAIANNQSVPQWNPLLEEEPVELLEEPVVQPSTNPTKYAVAINGSVDIHNAIFDTMTEAEDYMGSDPIYNLMQLSPSTVVEIHTI